MRTEDEVRAAKAAIDWLYEGAAPDSPVEREIAAMGGLLKWVLGDDHGHVSRVLARVKVYMTTDVPPEAP